MTNPQLITTPFAENGTKNIIPEGGASEPQLATMQAGFPEITQRPINEGGIPPERADFNGILNLYGQHLVHLNKGLPYEFDQDFANSIGGYPINARIMLSSGEVVQNTQEGNTNNPNSNMGGWKSSAVSKDVTVPTYKTVSDGVNPVTGVTDGSYFNVRSEDDDTVAVEYQNVGGMATPTGRGYPSVAALRDRSLNLDDFKTGANTDADAFYAMLAYAKEKGIKSLNITRDITLDRKITTIQDSSGYLNNLTINTNGFNIHYTGPGANSLYVGVFEVRGFLTDVTTTVLGDHAEYTSDLTVASASGFSVGDYILIRSTSTAKPDVYLNHVVKIEAISGNVLQTDTVRRLAVRPSVSAVNVTKLNTVDNFKLIGNSLVTADGQTERSNGIGAVILTYASSSQIIIKSEGLWFKTISANNCHRCTIIGENKHAAATGGGEGYCVQLQYCTHSIAKGLGEYLRHTTDCTASWHCIFLDSFDYYAVSGSFIHHCAYEYNIKYFNCHSYFSETNGFALGIVSGGFGDHSDEIELINCGSLMSKGDTISFANKGKGLTIRGGVFDADSSFAAYSLLASNNDTKVFDAKLLKGVQCTTSAEMYTGGVFEIYNSETMAGASTRALNVAAGRNIRTFNGSIDGRWTLADSSSVETNNTDIIFPAGAQLLQLSGGNHKITNNQGKQIYPTGAVTSQVINVSKYRAESVELVSNGSSLTITNSSPDVTYSRCFGSGSIVISGSTNVNVSSNKHTANSSNIALNITGVIGRVVCSSNDLKGSAVITLNIHSSCVLSKSSISDNNTSGRISIPDATIQSAIVKNNICAAGSTFPIAATNKIIADNLVV